MFCAETGNNPAEKIKKKRAMRFRKLCLKTTEVHTTWFTAPLLQTQKDSLLAMQKGTAGCDDS